MANAQTKTEGKDEKQLAKMVSACMLENSMCFVVGCGIGLALGLQRKSFRPFILSITLGTIGDMVVGYTFSCRQLIEDYKRAKAGIKITENEGNETEKKPFFGIKTSRKPPL